MDEQTTSVAEIAGIAIDLAKVPRHESGARTGGFRIRSTGRGHLADDGSTPVARCELVTDTRS